MREHKVKTFVVILGLYAAHKSFGLYKSIKSALNPLGDLEELEGEDGADGNNMGSSPESADKALFTSYMRADPLHLMQVKILQLSLKNVHGNLPKQVTFLAKAVEQHYNLTEAGTRAKERSESLTLQQKVQNWQTLTQQLIKTIFGEIYSTCLANLMSKVQFAQSGKLFFFAERRSKQTKAGEDADAEAVPLG